jgi:hypothetical protein
MLLIGTLSSQRKDFDMKIRIVLSSAYIRSSAVDLRYVVQVKRGFWCGWENVGSSVSLHEAWQIVAQIAADRVAAVPVT